MNLEFSNATLRTAMQIYSALAAVAVNHDIYAHL